VSAPGAAARPGTPPPAPDQRKAGHRVPPCASPGAARPDRTVRRTGSRERRADPGGASGRTPDPCRAGTGPSGGETGPPGLPERVRRTSGNRPGIDGKSVGKAERIRREGRVNPPGRQSESAGKRPEIHWEDAGIAPGRCRRNSPEGGGRPPETSSHAPVIRTRPLLRIPVWRTRTGASPHPDGRRGTGRETRAGIPQEKPRRNGAGGACAGGRWDRGGRKAGNPGGRRDSPLGSPRVRAGRTGRSGPDRQTQVSSHIRSRQSSSGIEVPAYSGWK
jgi:hypothetical protein